MKNRLIALALSIALCSGYTITPAVLAASQPGRANIPMIKSSISQNASLIELTLGKAQVVHLNQPATRISISDPDVVSMVVISPTEVELIGKKVGVANLLVWSEKSGQNYLAIDLSVNRDVSTLARKIQMVDPGINILPVAAEDSVILTGVAESHEKAQLAYDLAKAFFNTEAAAGAAGAVAPSGGGTTSNSAGSASFAETSTQIINLIRVIGQPSTKAEMVQERLKDVDPNITLNVVPGFGGKEKAILTGRVRNATMVSKAVNLTSIFYGTPGIKMVAGPGGNAVKESSEEAGSTGFTPGDAAGLIGNLTGNVLHGSIITDTSGNVVSMLEVEERPQIKCSIKFLEVRKDDRLDLSSSTLLKGTEISASSYAGATSKLTTSEFFSQIRGNNAAQLGVRYGRDLASIINGLVTNGKARILAEPTITAISGEPATFLAGGEFPIPLSNVNGQITVQYREFGVRLNILPTVTDRGTIHMQVSPEVSSLDPAAGITIAGFVIPGLRSRKSQTVIEMRDGDNFVLSGLYNQDMTDTILKTPILGQIPILGALFRSKAYRNAETEMVIVIHPEVQSSMNLSNVQPNSEVREVTRIRPEDAFPNFKKVAPELPQEQEIVKASMAVQTMVPEEKVMLPLPATPEAIQKSDATRIEERNPEKAKPEEPVQRKAQNKPKATARNAETPNSTKAVVKPAVVAAASLNTSPPQNRKESDAGQKPSAAATAHVEAAKSNPRITPTQAVEEEYMKSQKETLAKLIQDLQQPSAAILMMGIIEPASPSQESTKAPTPAGEPKRPVAEASGSKKSEKPQPSLENPSKSLNKPPISQVSRPKEQPKALKSKNNQEVKSEKSTSSVPAPNPKPAPKKAASGQKPAEKRFAMQSGIAFLSEHGLSRIKQALPQLTNFRIF